MRYVTSREYKFLLRHKKFVDFDKACRNFWRYLGDTAKSQKLRTKERKAEPEHREIEFLDTEDRTIFNAGLLLRRRTAADGAVQFTLKCRSPDRYLADGADLSPAPKQGFDEDDVDRKFEEDVGVPFVSRFSQSTSITFPHGKVGKQALHLDQAAKVFPILKHLGRDRRAKANPVLKVVGKQRIAEQVFRGPDLVFRSEAKKVKAQTALIVWHIDGRPAPAVVEFSFRYKAKKERVSPLVSRQAMTLYRALQETVWFDPAVDSTKTSFVYRS